MIIHPTILAKRGIPSLVNKRFLRYLILQLNQGFPTGSVPTPWGSLEREGGRWKGKMKKRVGRGSLGVAGVTGVGERFRILNNQLVYWFVVYATFLSPDSRKMHKSNPTTNQSVTRIKK